MMGSFNPPDESFLTHRTYQSSKDSLLKRNSIETDLYFVIHHPNHHFNINVPSRTV